MPDLVGKSQAEIGRAGCRLRARTAVVVSVLAIAVAAMLPSCSSGGSKSGDGAATTGHESVVPTSVLPAPDDPEIRLVEHQFGVTEVPPGATRLVTIGGDAAVYALAVGADLAAAIVEPDQVVVRSVLTARDVPILDFSAMSDLAEQLRPYEPEMILAVQRDAAKAQYEVYSKLCPTLLVDQTEGWEKILDLTGRLTGRRAIAEFRRDAITAIQSASLQKTIDEGRSGFTVSVLGASGRAPITLDPLGLASETTAAAGYLRSSSEVDQGAVASDGTMPLLSPLSGHVDMVMLLSDSEPAVLQGVLPANFDGEPRTVARDIWTGESPLTILWVLADLEAVFGDDHADLNSVGTVDNAAERWDRFFPS